MKSDGHITVEKTAKKYKLFLLLSSLGVIISVIWFVKVSADAETIEDTDIALVPAALFLISAIVYVVTKIIIWWNHG